MNLMKMIFVCMAMFTITWSSAAFDTDVSVETDAAAVSQPAAEQPAVNPADIDSDEEAIAAAKLLIEAVENGQWVIAVSLALSLAVWFIERFKLLNSVKEPVYTIAGIVLPVVAGVAVQLYFVEEVTVSAIVLAAIQGFFAAGAVTLIGNALQRQEVKSLSDGSSSEA